MTISFTGAGGLFTRLGKVFYLAKAVDEIYDGDSPDDITAFSAGIEAELEDALEQIDGTNVSMRAAAKGVFDAWDSWKSSGASFTLAVKTLAEQILIEQLNADKPLPSKTVFHALKELVLQMETASQTVDASVPTVTVTAGSNTGDGKGDAAVLDVNGKYKGAVFAENIVCECSDTETAGNELFTCLGVEAVQDKLHPDWPGGSGAIITVAAKNPGGSENLISNGNFDTWAGSPSSPTGWDITTGTWGTDVVEETSSTYPSGGKSAKFVGGGTSAVIRQNITASVDDQTPYIIACRVMVDVVPATGIITIDLFDGTNVIANLNFGNSLAIPLTGLTGGQWNFRSAIFCLPKPMPSSVHLRIRESTGIASGTNCYIDHLILAVADLAYAGGPYFAIVAGQTAFQLNDKITLAVSNSRAGAFESWFDRILDAGSNGAVLPANGAGAETISDSLIG